MMHDRPQQLCFCEPGLLPQEIVHERSDLGRRDFLQGSVPTGPEQHGRSSCFAKDLIHLIATHMLFALLDES
jgi:hypothetical protein